MEPGQLADRARRDDISAAAGAGRQQPHRALQLAYTMTDEDERELQAELARLQEANDVLAAGVSHELIVTSREREPALT